MGEEELLKQLVDEIKSLKLLLMKDFTDIKYSLTKIEKNTVPRLKEL